MKKFLLFISVLALGLNSCNNDDNTASNPPSDTNGTLEGRWEFLQTGQIVNGQEQLSNYPHSAGCIKDYNEFVTGGIFKDHTSFNAGGSASNCTVSITTGNWVRNENALMFTLGNTTSITADIMILNATTLKIKYTELEGSTPVTRVVVYKRISNNDGNPTPPPLEGSWEYATEGVIFNGQETYSEYQHTDGCTKNYVVFTPTTATDHQFYLDGDGSCAQDVTTVPYTRNGNTITIIVDGETQVAQIEELTATTLRMRTTDTFEGQQVDYIMIYQRIN
ncbi:MAG TPA: lipocalin family protein [Flavobacterium sp.]|nr:lipocalin family protein [Flavobacterium sp.]